MTAFQNKDAKTCADCYTLDAFYAACGSQPIRGRSEIESLHESIIDSGFQILGIEIIDIEVSGSLAYSLETVKGSEGNSTALLVLKLDEDGQWRVCAESEVS